MRIGRKDGTSFLTPETAPNDEELLRLYANGDPRAASVLTTRLLPRVYHQARRLLGDNSEAEDISQEAMLRLWRIAPEWRSGEAQVSTWLYRVTANLCMDRLRRRRSVGLDEIDEPADGRLSVEENLQNGSRADALAQALNQLPDRQRQAVILRHLEGLGNPQIAEIMEISPRAVESLIARGKRALTVGLSGRREELGYENET
ncbi:MAG: RNA polymerase sigma factor [Roseobacter sp.]